MGSSRRRKRKRKWSFEWAITSSVPEDLDTIEEEESEESPTIHSARYRKLRLLSTSSDDSGIAIGMQTLRKETLIMTQKMRQIPVKKG